jgi:hypothetical protein
MICCVGCDQVKHDKVNINAEVFLQVCIRLQRVITLRRGHPPTRGDNNEQMRLATTPEPEHLRAGALLWQPSVSWK